MPGATIQRGSISLSTAQASNTATISSVDTSNSIICISSNDSLEQDRMARNVVDIDFNSATEIQATRGTASSAGNIDVEYAVIEFDAGALDSINKYTFDATADPQSVAVTDVVAAQSILIGSFYRTNNDAVLTDAWGCYQFTESGGNITDVSVTFQATPATGDHLGTFWLVEFKSADVSVDHVYGTFSGHTDPAPSIGITCTAGARAALCNGCTYVANDFGRHTYELTFSSTTALSLRKSGNGTGVNNDYSVSALSFLGDDATEEVSWAIASSGTTATSGTFGALGDTTACVLTGMTPWNGAPTSAPLVISGVLTNRQFNAGRTAIVATRKTSPAVAYDLTDFAVDWAAAAGGTWPHNPLGHPLIGGLGGPIG